MTEHDDRTLLHDWVRSASQAAFATLATRYAGLLFHAALRATGRAELAEEAAQNALAILARKAARVTPEPSLAPWLHRTVCYEAAKLLRRERRHEVRMNAMTHDSADRGPDPWKNAAPHLDAALNALPEADRRVLLLKYFDGWTFEQMAERLGGQAAAWRQRGSRAVERLRRVFARRGHALSAAALAAGLGASFSATAPPAVAATLTTVPLTAAAGLSWKTLLLHTLHIMNMKQAAVAGAVAIAALVPLGMQYQAVAGARSRVETLETTVRVRRGAVTTAEIANASVSRGARAKGKAAAAPAQAAIDLVAWAEVLAESRTGAISFDRMLEVERALMALDADTLEKLCLEAAGLKIAPEKRHGLVERLLAQLFQKDQSGRRIVELTAAMCRVDNSERMLDRWHQSGTALSQWAGREPAAARVWLEKAESEGLLDGKALHRRDVLINLMRGQLFAGLFTSDRTAALALLDSLDESGKARAINILGMRHGEPGDLLELTATLSPDLKIQSLSNTARKLVESDPEAAAKFIAGANLPEREYRMLMISAAQGNMGPMTAEEVADRAAWLRRNVPEAEREKSVGYFLGERASMDPAGAKKALDAELASGSNDELLGAYNSRTARTGVAASPGRTLREAPDHSPESEIRRAAEEAAMSAREVERAMRERER